MLKEFKKFVLRGNVIDLAVAVVIATAFSAIVASVVNDIVMPVVGYITAGVSFSEFKVVLTPAVMEAGEVVTPEVAIAYGNLIQTIIQFLIIAATIFLVVKGISNMQRRFDKFKKVEAEVVADKAADVVLLEEIRDLLKK